MQKRASQFVRIGFVTAAVLIVALCAGAIRFAREYVGAAAWVTHTTQVITEIRETRMLLAGTGVLSGGALQVKAGTILEQFRRVEDLVGDNPSQQASAREFRQIFTPPLQQQERVNWRVEAPGMAAASAILDRMSQEEERLLIERIEVQTTATSKAAAATCQLCVALLLLGLLTGIAAHRESRGRELAERALMTDKDELTRYSRKLTLVSAGSELIQAAREEAHIHEAVAQVMRDMLPGSRGYFGMISPSKDLVEICGTWGKGIEAKPFTPEGCLSLQLSRPMHRQNSPIRVTCEHARGCTGDYVCIPVRGASGPLGVLYVECEITLTEKQVDVITLFAAHVGLGLTNLRMREALRRQTVRDALTGLFNRRYFDETLRRELAAITRHGMPVSVVMFDVDHFKVLNDTHGHAGGDDALKGLARMIRSGFRAGDVLCRYGGEEFAVILPGASLEDAWERSESFRRAVEQAEFSSNGRSLGRLTISLGVAASTEFHDPDELVRAADVALYQAKHMGRNAAWVCSDRASQMPAIPIASVESAKALPSEEAAWLVGAS